MCVVDLKLKIDAISEYQIVQKSIYKLLIYITSYIFLCKRSILRIVKPKNEQSRFF